MEEYRKLKNFVNRSFFTMDKQIQQLAFESQDPAHIEDALETFIADLVKVVFAFSRDPRGLIIANYNIEDEDRIDFRIG
jgi:hypothetical protein